MGLLDQTPLDDDGLCFACGRRNPQGLGMRVERQPEARAARCRLSLPARFQGWAGIAHGGVVSTLLDEIMGHAVIASLGPAVTTEMQVRYRAPVPLEREITVRGWVAESKSRMVMARAEVRLAGEDRLLAEAEARFLLRRDCRRADP